LVEGSEGVLGNIGFRGLGRVVKEAHKIIRDSPDAFLLRLLLLMIRRGLFKCKEVI
jgi:hypothetical protein